MRPLRTAKKPPTTSRTAPVCRVCERGFALGEAAIRDANGMVHVECSGLDTPQRVDGGTSVEQT